MPDRSDELVNVALNCPAKQSSHSEWSQPDEAKNAVSGVKPTDYAFHTAREHKPWWSVDLVRAYDIEAIAISNRIGGWHHRARHIRIEVAADEQLDWHTLHAGYSVFGSKWSGDAFVIWLKGHVNARFIKLSLDETEMLHLSQVEVFANRKSVAFRDFCEGNGLKRLPQVNKSMSRPYAVTDTHGGPETITGIDINYSGRFGNLLIQLVNAIELAKKTGLKYIRLGKHPLLGTKNDIEIDGITYLPNGANLELKGRFLSGEFFNSDPFGPVLMPFLNFTDEFERSFTAIVQQVIRPYLLTGIPYASEVRHNDEVTVHLRAGDVFAEYTPVVRGYRQPPLSFYQLTILRLREMFGVNKAKLVFEDYGNPCVGALIAWLKDINMPIRLQRGTVEQDMSALIDAPHLVFGHGTFGYAACRLSRHIKTLHYYEPELGGRYGAIPQIDHIYSVSDAGDYITAYEYGKPFPEHLGWFNTDENRAAMLSYPIAYLSVKELIK